MRNSGIHSDVTMEFSWGFYSNNMFNFSEFSDALTPITNVRDSDATICGLINGETQ